jgi:hypothetical protein
LLFSAIVLRSSIPLLRLVALPAFRPEEGAKAEADPARRARDAAATFMVAFASLEKKQ